MTLKGIVLFLVLNETTGNCFGFSYPINQGPMKTFKQLFLALDKNHHGRELVFVFLLDINN